MKIIRLQAENVKKLRAIEIIPEGPMVLISGRNNVGKTSVLDSIWLAVGGAEAEKTLSRPIRDGEDHAQVVLDLDEYLFTRTCTGTAWPSSSRWPRIGITSSGSRWWTTRARWGSRSRTGW